MTFEIGKFYKHNSGNMMNPLVEVDTTLYGKALLAECVFTPIFSIEFKCVKRDEISASNWSEISREEWMKNFT